MNFIQKFLCNYFSNFFPVWCSDPNKYYEGWDYNVKKM